jgi:mannose/fructose/N-acetylgalactosamine-specific phosphotransferase system component IID
VDGWGPDTVNDTHKRIGIVGLCRVFLRALLIQASWSYERMQSLGFAYAIEPTLRKLYPDQAEYVSRLRLHLEYFNTQPYLASYILGAAIRIEEDRAAGMDACGDISSLKTALMSPLGAVGDSFFWGALKPLAAMVSVALIMTGFWWAPLVFLVFYNVWHVGLRAGMLFSGYRSGGDAVAIMTRYSLMKTAKRFKLTTLAVLGGIIGMLPYWRTEFLPECSGPLFPVALLWLAITMALVAILRRGGSPIKLMLGLAALCLVLAYAGVVR